MSLQKSAPLYVCAYYRPPNDTITALDSLQKDLDEVQLHLDKKTPVHA